MHEWFFYFFVMLVHGFHSTTATKLVYASVDYDGRLLEFVGSLILSAVGLVDVLACNTYRTILWLVVVYQGDLHSEIGLHVFESFYSMIRIIRLRCFSYRDDNERKLPKSYPDMSARTSFIWISNHACPRGLF